MVDVVSATYALGTVGMLAGLAIVVKLLGDAGADTTGKFGYLLIIPGFAALMYALMAVGVGTLTLQGFTIPVPRYVDWAVTTPVLIGYTAYVAGMDSRWVVGVALADAVMIALGGVAVATAPPLRWVAFGASSLTHLALLGVLYGVLPDQLARQPSKRRRLGKVLQNHVGLLWIAYPAIWVAGPGLELISATALSMIITYLDVVAKTPFVYFIYRSRDVFETGAATSSDASTGSGPQPAVNAD